MPICLRIVDECSAQDVADPLGGQLRVALVNSQLPPRAAVEYKRDPDYGKSPTV